MRPTNYGAGVASGVKTPNPSLTKDTRIRDAHELIYLAPTLVREDDTLFEVLRKLVSDPRARVAFVVDHQERLAGMIPLAVVDRSFLYAFLPEEMDFEAADFPAIVAAAQANPRTAREMMLPPVFVRLDEPLKNAVVQMHRHKTEVVAIVDEDLRVVGYLDMFQLLSSLTALRRP